tara:strand:- start:1693 stop:2433 length:741 start_codon:yes stop_codon:yes gene_type:complete
MEKNIEKLVFVTGASRGIGKATAEWFKERGYCVAHGFFSNMEMSLKPLKDDNNLSVRLNIQNRTSIKQAIKCVEAHFNKKISVLVNNAAIAQEKEFTTISDRDFDLMLTTNLKGPFMFCQEVLPNMVQANWGRIVNISSIGGQWGGINQVHYAASKAGLINLTMSIAKNYSLGGITCNAVSPGLVQTDMSANEIRSVAGKKKIESIPLGRVANTSEIASVVGYLASNEASYVTGQTISVNGGMYFG